MVLAVGVFALDAQPKTNDKASIPSGSKVFISPMGGFETYLVAALQNKKVPVMVVSDSASADYLITGTSNSQKASWAKILMTWDSHSTEEAGINIVSKSGVVVFAYAVQKYSAFHGRQSTAEACAKQLRDFMKKH